MDLRSWSSVDTSSQSLPFDGSKKCGTEPLNYRILDDKGSGGKLLGKTKRFFSEVFVSLIGRDYGAHFL